jgi:tetratricopeptide (TPR) repeat protein
MNRRYKMATESKSAVYERGLELAEAGQHEQALECINQYLKTHLKDGQAWNDAGAILYCLGKVDEAIEYFERAKALCGESAEIYWNLAEAYLDGGHPGFVVRLFDGMERLEILTADLMNRTANVFLQQEYYGNATETLLRSLEFSPDQEILHPMVEVIRSKRPKVAFFCGHDSESVKQVFEFVKQRFMAELHVAESLSEIRPIMEWCDIAWFEGCGEVAVEASQFPKVCEMIVRVGVDDVYEQWPERVKWENVDTLITRGNSFAMEALVDKVSDVQKRTRVVTIERGVDVGRFEFTEKRRGKRIGCAGDLNTKSNPMFLLQCMQKLHYLDADYRLYFSGEFEDAAVEQYVKHMIEALGLSNAVFFDGKQKNMKAWLRDKHYIVSTSIADGDLAAVLEGMACGLKPVVHNFPGAGEILPAEFLFNLAEDFCRQILSETYEPARYRGIVTQKYSSKAEMKQINEVFVRVEKGIAEQRRMLEKRQASQAEMRGSGAVGVDAVQWQEPERSGFARSQPEAGAPKRLPVKAIPIKPITPKRLDIRVNTPVSTNQQDAGSIGVPWDGSGSLNKPKVTSSPASVGGAASISQVAAEAVRASRALAQAANQSDIERRQESWDTTDAQITDLSQMGYGSLEASVRDNKIAQAASEFSDDANDTNNRVKRVKVNRVAFDT